MFFLARTGGEGRDLGRYMGEWTNVAGDKEKHYLEPNSVELEVIQYLNDTFDNVILVVNTNNAFELGWVADYPSISAVLWAPGAGGDTCRSIADVLSGAVNPSGHLVDTFAYDAFSSPAMQNMGDMMMVNGGQDVGAGVFYDEGIYVGYKYYETRYFDKVLDQATPVTTIMPPPCSIPSASASPTPPLSGPISSWALWMRTATWRSRSP